MDLVVIGKNPYITGSIEIDQRLNQNMNTVSFRDIDAAIKYLTQNKADCVVLVGYEKDIEKIKAVHCGKIVGMRAPMRIYRTTKLDNKIANFFVKYGISAILNPLFATIIKFGCQVLNKLGIRVSILSLMINRIGHLACNNHILLSSLDTGRRRVLIGVYEGDPASPQLLKMLKRNFIFMTSNAWIRTLLEHPIIQESGYYVDGHFTTDAVVPVQSVDTGKRFFRWTETEKRQGQYLLSELGLAGEWFISVHNRDKVYLDTVAKGIDWKYHKFRDCEIDTYGLACQYITELYGNVIRVGAVAEKRLSCADNKSIIDLPFSTANTDFLNMYILSESKFLLGATSGIPGVALAFGTPAAVANWAHIELLTCFRKGDYFIPKRLWLNEQGRYLSLSEILNSGIGRIIRSEILTSAGVEMVDNTAEDILALCREMNLRIDGAWIDTDEDKVLQAQFRAIIDQPQFLCNGSGAEIATSFLRKYNEWSE